MSLTHKFITKKIIVGFLEFLNQNLLLEKLSWDSTNNEYVTRKLIQVPIQFGIHDKYFSIVNSSSARKTFPPENSHAPLDLGRIYPRCGVSLTGLVFDSARKINKTNKLEFVNGQYSIAPVPYNMEIEVGIATRSLDDSFQLLEIITPFFTPSLSLDMILFEDSESIPITLNSIALDFPTELSENEERVFIVNYYFTIRANYYLQKKTGNRVENITVNFRDDTDKLWEHWRVC